MKRIILSLLCLMILAILVQWFESGFESIFWVPISVFISLTLGTVIGIPLLVSIYGFLPLAFAIFAIVITGYGFKNHKTGIGQVLAVTGVISWLLIGAYGLGHAG